MAYGIDALNIYAGVAHITVPDLFTGRGLDPSRLANLAMREKSVGLPVEDPVTNAANAARPILDAMSPDDRDSIELLVTATESGVDLSKTVASYVHRHLELPRHCRVFETKQACYAATGAVQLATGYLASQASPGAKALVIATDVALVDERAQYAEPATGHGAVAILLSEDPAVLAIDHGAFGCYSHEVLDSARPTPTFDIADVDKSLFTYLDGLAACYDDYCDRVAEVDFTTTFGHLAFHTPFAGLVRAAHRKLMRERTRTPVDKIDADFDDRVAPSLLYPAATGNLCSGSVYLALASLLDHVEISAPTRVGLYSYGSGCSAEFFSGLVTARSVRRMAEFDVGGQLRERTRLDYEDYLRILRSSLTVLEPRRDHRVDVEPYRHLFTHRRSPFLAYTGTRDHHRRYRWY